MHWFNIFMTFDRKRKLPVVPGKYCPLVETGVLDNLREKYFENLSRGKSAHCTKVKTHTDGTLGVRTPFSTYITSIVCSHSSSVW